MTIEILSSFHPGTTQIGDFIIEPWQLVYSVLLEIAAGDK